ncbi:hypothetical protein G3145_004742 [Salmonella enterica subsp. enterica serovar Montevideo]|nr:hypothetical protein [Salmonella enterica]EBG5176302.1 hypothetical protein [Salmonella enterica subsp. enterica serovar Panama]EBS1128225.1 hypothetical protein [Salmonella enterica subsp. enterica serovar Montevideo]ECI7009069.1 hypothetical protein [Salmonella enterica subsp. enterica]ECZ9314669.1 hypothetical protein [Salmonella enterica subsp. enterica serovar Newport]EDQ3692429.1 hypothetical protein [Salmonella enterica subsp. enterica serovar Bonariensis]EDS5123834.1 hypothetical p
MDCEPGRINASPLSRNVSRWRFSFAVNVSRNRNHQCRSMWPLLKKVRHFMETVSPFPGGKHGLAKV